MKHFSLIIFLLGFGFSIYSQDSISTYYNINWKKCDKSEAAYFRVIKHPSNKIWVANDYYISGEIQMIGHYSDKKCTKKEGDFFYYFKNGQVSQKVSYNNNLLDGTRYAYFVDGSVSEQGEYKLGKKNGGFKYLYKSGTVAWYEQFRMDTLVLKELWNDKSQELDPEFPPYMQAFIAGGSKTLYYLISENFSYPNQYLNKDCKIDVEVFFNVSAEGKISDVKVKGAQEKWMETEMIRVFSLMPKWHPALDHLRPIDSEVSLPIILKHKGQ